MDTNTQDRKGISRDNSIVVWRIFFAYVIVVFHFLGAYNITTSLYIATDFFFIVSGFILASEASDKKYKNAFCMLKKRIKSYYPHYLLSLIVGFVVFRVLGNGPQVSLLGLAVEASFIQMIGINLTAMVNVPTWYLSVLLLSGYLIYFLYQNFEKLFVELICPISVIVILSWFYRNCGILDHTSLGESCTTGIYWNRPFLLGFAMMCLGVIGYRLYSLYSGVCRWSGLAHIFETTFLITVPLLACLYRRTPLDFIMIGMVFLGIISAFGNCSSKIFQNKIVRYFSRLSYPVYLNHNMFRVLFPCYIKTYSTWLLLEYLIMVTLYSMLTMMIIEKIKKLYERKKQNGKNNYSSCTCERE